jgi:hypothetical protein
VVPVFLMRLVRLRDLLAMTHRSDRHFKF